MACSGVSDIADAPGDVTADLKVPLERVLRRERVDGAVLVVGPHTDTHRQTDVVTDSE